MLKCMAIQQQNSLISWYLRKKVLLERRNRLHLNSIHLNWSVYDVHTVYWPRGCIKMQRKMRGRVTGRTKYTLQLRPVVHVKNLWIFENRLRTKCWSCLTWRWSASAWEHTLLESVSNEPFTISEFWFENQFICLFISGGKRLRSGKIGKIVGLDPAFPLFSMDKPEDRLDTNDATYVEIIHTSRAGFFQPIGMVNFYPNGGKKQKGCRSWNIVSSYEITLLLRKKKSWAFSKGVSTSSLIQIFRWKCFI